MRYNPEFCNVYAQRKIADPEATLAQQYQSEIRSLITDLHEVLPAYRKGTDRKTYNLVYENLEVLTTCFNTNALNVQALGVLRDHLWMLLRTLNYRSTQAKN